MIENSINTEAAILRAAENEFINKGFSGSRTTAIAAAAGVTHTMLHYYFRTKEMLFNRVLEEKINMLIGEMTEVLKSTEGKDIITKIRSFAERHFDIVTKNPDLPMFVFNELKTNPNKLKIIINRLEGFVKSLTNEYQQELNKATERGEICKISFVNIIINIISLNIMSVKLADIFIPVMHLDREKYLTERKKENINTLLKRLTPDIK